MEYLKLENNIAVECLNWPTGVLPDWSDYIEGGPSQIGFELVNGELVDNRELTYIDRRQEAYPPIEAQLDIIFNQGIEGWRAAISDIKTAIPKEDLTP